MDLQPGHMICFVNVFFRMTKYTSDFIFDTHTSSPGRMISAKYSEMDDVVGRQCGFDIDIVKDDDCHDTCALACSGESITDIFGGRQ